jgi:hypothetical protein
MFPKFKLTLPNSVFVARKNLKSRAKADFKRELQTKVKPELQRQVDDLLGGDPGPVSRPFVFATEKSRRAYFATNGFGKGIPFRRDDSIRTSWRVRVISRLSRDFAVIDNPKEAAKYVYGSPSQRQVPGHKNTGWGKDFEESIETIQENGVAMIVSAWKRSILKSLKVA